MISKPMVIGSIAFIGFYIIACYEINEPKDDNESNEQNSDSDLPFLAPCDDNDCAEGLYCICGVCTKYCIGDSDCATTQDKASCIVADYPKSLMCYYAACDQACDSDSDCVALEANTKCVDGYCRIQDSNAGSPPVIDSFTTKLPRVNCGGGARILDGPRA